MAAGPVKFILPFERIAARHRPFVGGKAFALAALHRAGLKAPPGIVVTTRGYSEFVSRSGLSEGISLELSRKRFQDMRWEEVWDAALRIRNLFLTAPLAGELEQEIQHEISARFADQAVVVRSSAPAEDSAKASFAGLHESYVNVKGAPDILKSVRMVWASLWSDRALLYRQELGLDPAESAMAVVIQPLVSGDRSGIAFTCSPNDPAQAVVEAVYGLNQGLVDGDIEPDRWTLERKSGRVLSHTPAARERKATPGTDGVTLGPLPPDERNRPPLDDTDLKEVFDLAMSAEERFGAPQDVEWTFREQSLHALQSRPITTSATNESGDNRGWYLSLTRTFENLKSLRRNVEEDRLPEMATEAETLEKQEISGLSDAALAAEIERRGRIHERWKQIYWDEFIPLAHGARLFGQVYNDRVQPEDPFEFTRLLGATEMISLQRNRELARLASRLRELPKVLAEIRGGNTDLPADMSGAVDGFLKQFGLPGGAAGSGRGGLVRLLAEMADREPVKEAPGLQNVERLREKFFAGFPGDRQEYARELLDLGRASYRLRDNDNIYLGAIEREWMRAVEIGRSRLQSRRASLPDTLPTGAVVRRLRGESLEDSRPSPNTRKVAETDFEPRQLLGQPAGPGIATGSARVILDTNDIFKVKAGEVLICDAIDPNMTFVVPLASAVVERRGGMLIHGAIIAREYGLPCVTGVPNATSFIRTGDRLTVDGFLGIVVVRSREKSADGEKPGKERHQQGDRNQRKSRTGDDEPADDAAVAAFALDENGDGRNRRDGAL